MMMSDFQFPSFSVSRPGMCCPESCTDPTHPSPTPLRCRKRTPGPGRGRPPLAHSDPVCAVHGCPLPALPVARPAPHAPTVSSVRQRLGHHKLTTRCASSFFEQQMRHLPIVMLGKVWSEVGRRRREMGPPEKNLRFLNFLSHKQSESGTVNH
jgi:hypothetical protein